MKQMVLWGPLKNTGNVVGDRMYSTIYKLAKQVSESARQTDSRKEDVSVMLFTVMGSMVMRYFVFLGKMDKNIYVYISGFVLSTLALAMFKAVKEGVMSSVIFSCIALVINTFLLMSILS